MLFNLLVVSTVLVFFWFTITILRVVKYERLHPFLQRHYIKPQSPIIPLVVFILLSTVIYSL